MKGDFIVKLLTEITDFIVDLSLLWIKVPYKGFRYSDFYLDGLEESKKYYGFKNLQRRGIIKGARSNQFVFTKKGKKWFEKSMIKYFRNKNRGQWDKKWRLVIFDIPKEMHKERVRFREKLKFLGFAMLQKSVFIFPYSCDEEVADLSSTLNVGDYVDLIVAETAGFKEEEFLKEFGLRRD